MTRRQVGLPDLDVSLINRSIWRVSMQIAETFRKGRVSHCRRCGASLPADRCFGMNTGIQDAHNLAWKPWRSC